jgi:hypothetical protein
MIAANRWGSMMVEDWSKNRERVPRPVGGRRPDCNSTRVLRAPLSQGRSTILSDPLGAPPERGHSVLLTRFRVRGFRNILDSTDVAVDEHVTCLVGKNESGKTALLHALWRQKPHLETMFDAQDHYPRWLLTQHRRHGLVEKTETISATFTLDADDKAAVEERLGPGTLTSDEFTYSVGYAGKTWAIIGIDSHRAVENHLKNLGLNAATVAALKDAPNFGDLADRVEARRDELAGKTEDEVGDLAVLRSDLDTLTSEMPSRSAWQQGVNVLRSRIPTFFYFSDYQILPGRVDLSDLEDEADLPAASPLQTARALLQLAGTQTASLREDEYEERKAELEAVSNDLTRQVFEYWRQNQDLSVEIDIDKETISNPGQYGRNESAVARFLDIRVKDRRHGFTNNFGQRSSGFQWFFSFLAAFSEFEAREQSVIILLDEPALTLHGKAQADFLRFIEERLAPVGQVIYTTHSPFMVDMAHLERARIVEDKGPDTGAVVSDEVLSVGSDSLFPLQAALGYDIAQSLFVGEANLVVEGTSDFTYLTVLSDHLRQLGRSFLDPDWRVLPAGGASKVPAFVALMGRALDVTVLVDSGTQGMQRLSSLAEVGLLERSRFLTLGTLLGRKNADVEDLFSEGDYLALYNAAFGSKWKVADLPPGDRIVDRISRATEVPFTDHGLPADYLLRNRDKVLPKFSAATLDRFEQLIESINQTRP